MFVFVQLAPTKDTIDPALHSPVRTDISSEHNVCVSVQWTASKILINNTDLRQRERESERDEIRKEKANVR